MRNIEVMTSRKHLYPAVNGLVFLMDKEKSKIVLLIDLRDLNILWMNQYHHPGQTRNPVFFLRSSGLVSSTDKTPANWPRMTHHRWRSGRPGGSRRSRAECPDGSTTPTPSSPSRWCRRTDGRSSVEPSPPVRAVGGGTSQVKVFHLFSCKLLMNYCWINRKCFVMKTTQFG